jgi:hypothetical protein
MTRIRKTLISVLATSAVTVAIGSSAMAAEYSSVSALVGGQESATAPLNGHSSVNAIVGDGKVGERPTDHSSVNAITGDRVSSQKSLSRPAASASPSSVSSILGPDGVTRPSPVSPASTGSPDGFDWGDALIGAGVTLGLALTTALMLGMTRRRTRVEPSV